MISYFCFNSIFMIKRFFAILVLSFISISLHAQEILGKQFHDAVLTLGTNYTRSHDGTVTKLRYPAHTIDNPNYGTYRQVEQYDFIDGVCEARHYFIPIALRQKFIDGLNKKFGFADHLWQDDENHIAIKEHDNNFELIVWTPAYEKMLDSKY